MKKWDKSNKLRKQMIEKFLVEYLLFHPCVDCGHDDIRVLEFDHVRGKKLANISRMVFQKSLEKVKQEIAKCEVRCANCHRIQTAIRSNNYKQRYYLTENPYIFT